MFSEIYEIRNIKEQENALMERKKELSKPLLEDPSFIMEIYEWFNEINEVRDCSSRKNSLNTRKKFIFIIMYLYCPASLAGGIIKRGLRKSVCKVLNMHPSSISHNCTSVSFLYQRYSDFRDSVDYIYARIVERLKDKELIK